MEANQFTFAISLTNERADAITTADLGQLELKELPFSLIICEAPDGNAPTLTPPPMAANFLSIIAGGLPAWWLASTTRWLRSPAQRD